MHVQWSNLGTINCEVAKCYKQILGLRKIVTFLSCINRKLDRKWSVDWNEINRENIRGCRLQRVMERERESRKSWVIQKVTGLSNHLTNSPACILVRWKVDFIVLGKWKNPIYPSIKYKRGRSIDLKLYQSMTEEWTFTSIRPHTLPRADNEDAASKRWVVY